MAFVSKIKTFKMIKLMLPTIILGIVGFAMGKPQLSESQTVSFVPDPRKKPA